MAERCLTSECTHESQRTELLFESLCEVKATTELSITSSKRKDGRQMNENETQPFDDHRSFEERVFARFDAIDLRDSRLEGILGAVEIKITKLEERQYDTKPIWEQALSAILGVKADVAELKTSLAETNTNVAKNTEDLAALQSELGELRKDMQAGFTAARHEMEHELRKVARMLEVINENWFELKVDERYLDRRLALLEEQTKST